jgi:hypothetical protein
MLAVTDATIYQYKGKAEAINNSRKYASFGTAVTDLLGKVHGVPVDKETCVGYPMKLVSYYINEAVFPQLLKLFSKAYVMFVPVQIGERRYSFTNS